MSNIEDDEDEDDIEIDDDFVETLTSLIERGGIWACFVPLDNEDIANGLGIDVQFEYGPLPSIIGSLPVAIEKQIMVIEGAEKDHPDELEDELEEAAKIRDQLRRFADILDGEISKRR